MHIYPSILTDSVRDCQEQLTIAAADSGIEVVQIDIVDGFFADNITLTPVDLVGLEFGELKVDLHLMTDEPLDFVFETVAVKAKVPIRSIIAQIEHMSYQRSFLDELKVHGWKSGFSLDLFTPLDSIDEECWSELDIVQIMGIEAGFQGQTFHPTAIKKIADLIAMKEKFGYTFEVIVDGGVELALLPELSKLGVDGIAVGSALWQDSNPASALRDFITEQQQLQ